MSDVFPTRIFRNLLWPHGTEEVVRGKPGAAQPFVIDHFILFGGEIGRRCVTHERTVGISLPAFEAAASGFVILGSERPSPGGAVFAPYRIPVVSIELEFCLGVRVTTPVLSACTKAWWMRFPRPAKRRQGVHALCGCCLFLRSRAPPERGSARSDASAPAGGLHCIRRVKAL